MKALQSEWLAALAVGPIILGLAVAAGPMIGVGAIVGLAFAAVVIAFPIIGLTLMILGGTALQVLGSEHITGLPLSLGKIAGVLTLLAWLWRLLSGRIPLVYSPQLLALLLFAAVMAVSAQMAPDRGLADEGLFRYAQLGLLYFMIASLAGESKRMLDMTCLAFTAAMVVSVIIAILEFFVPSMSIEFEDPSLVQGAVGAVIDRDSIEGVEIKRVTGGLSDSNWFAYTLACVLPINLYLFHRYTGPAIRLAILAAASLQSFGIVLSYTRSGIVALVAVVIYLLVKRRLPLGPILAAGVVASIGIVLWNPPGLQRLFSPQYLQEGSTPLRSYLLRGGIALIMEQPIKGYGYSQYGPAFVKWVQHEPLTDSVEYWLSELETRVADGEDRVEWVMPHNLIVQIWVEYGLLGFVSFCGFLAFIFRDLRVAGRYGSEDMRELSDCLTAGTIAFIICGMFGHLAMLKIIWILGGLAVAARCVSLKPAQPVLSYPEARASPA